MSHKILNEDWEFNVLDVYNYRKPGRLAPYFDFVVENHNHIEGNLLEAGVFKGHSLIATGMLLKELKSNKIVYGYDSWSGFPPIYHEFDDFAQWEKLYQEGKITREHFEKIKKNKEYRGLSLRGKEITPANVSLSGNFSSCSREDLQKKLDYLGLDNIKLIQGSFNDTMSVDATSPFKKLMSAVIDADLYTSYVTALPFIWLRLSRGGYIWLDEYYSLKFPGGRIATDEFFKDLKDKPQCHKQVSGDFERWYVRKIFE